jgi:thiamine transporter
MKKKLTVRQIVFLALNVALGIGFELVASMFLKMPQGGTICISVLPIIFVGLKLNIFYSIVCGVLIGVGQGLVTPPTFVAFIQYFLDYILAFGVIGLSTFFWRYRPSRLTLFLGVTLTMVAKYMSHVVSGVVYFGEYATGNVIWYSAIYNGTYMLPSLILVLAVLMPLYRSVQRIQF